MSSEPVTEDKALAGSATSKGGDAEDKSLASYLAALEAQGAEERLEMALALVEVLARAHGEGQVVQNLSPRSFIIERREPLVVKLREQNGRNYDAFGADLLPYMAPEQTGRVALRIDHRADFYTLGVIFSQLFCGRLPLYATDPMGWVHAHIAHRPAPLDEQAAWGGAPLAALVDRLLEKSPDARYQSAHGLIQDLTHILEDVRAGIIPDFEIAREDIAEELQLPVTLFGRQHALERLEHAWASASAGQVAIASVRGWAGTGKSALVEQLRERVAASKGYFLSGTCEPGRQALPFEPVILAFADLIRQLLTEPEDRVQMWRNRLEEALGNNARLMTDVIPSLEALIGVHEAPPEIGVAESQNRFKLTFLKFVEVFCDVEHPIVMFIDDVHHVDAATRELLGLLLADARASHLLFVGAWRDDEKSNERAAPWRELLEQLSLSQWEVIELALGPLTEEDATSLVASALGASPARVSPLANALRRKTGGNPFFLRQMMHAMVERDVLWFDRRRRSWQWEMEGIEEIAIDEDIVELFASKIAELDNATERVLQVASCIGTRFDAALVAGVLDEPLEDVLGVLEDAVGHGLLATVNATTRERDLGGVFRFLHERIQQAAYLSIEEAQRQQWHLAIGRALRARFGENENAERLFDVVEQLGLVISELTPEERVDFAHLAMISAQRASAALAPEFAARCLEDAYGALGEDEQTRWSEHFDLAFPIVLADAENRYLLGDFERAEAQFSLASEKARDDLERARVAMGQVELLGHLGRHEEAVLLGVEALGALGYKVHHDPSTVAVVQEVARVRWALGRRKPSMLAESPEMQDVRVQATMRLIYQVAASANFVRENLFPLLALRMTYLSLRHGNMELSSFAYASYGLILGAVLGKHELGTEFGVLAMSLAERYADTQPGAHVRVLFLFGCMISPWTQDLRRALDLTRDSVNFGMDCGDFLYAGYAATLVAYDLLALGAPLEKALDEADQLDVFLTRGKDQDSINMARAAFQTMRAMAGQTHALSTMASDTYDEDARREEMRALDNGNPFYFQQLYKMQLLVLDGKFDEALQVAEATRVAPEGTLGLVAPLEHAFYEGIAAACQHAVAEPSDKTRLLGRLKKSARALAGGARKSPETFGARAMLLDALSAASRNNRDEAVALFESTIETARVAGLPQIEALAAWMASRFFEQRSALAARGYIERAVACWTTMGAVAVAKRWQPNPEAGASRALTPITGGHAAVRASTSTNHSLDLATILKANQALSGEIQLEKLLERMMAITIENAGATRGVFFFQTRDGGLVADAVGVAGGVIEVMQRIPLDHFSRVISGAIAFVARTREALVVEDVTQHPDFARDKWALEDGVRALLVMPIIHQSELTGILCLENNLTANVFTPERMQVLDVLSGQLAISLENALMYEEVEAARQDLEERVAERTQELEEINIELQREVTERERAQAQAIEASESKSMFLANMSHELRTPLNAIIGYSEMLTEDVADEIFDAGSMTSDLDKISIAARHLLSLINDILDLSKIEARKMEVVLEEVDIVSFVDEVSATARPLFDKNQNTFVVEKCAGVMKADRTRLRQILLNLLSNAAKFTERGEVRLEVEHVTSQTPHCYRFRVIDDGIGITPEQQGRLFKAFSQAEATTASKFGGTGLGLALSRELCRLMGGDISLESAEGEGSTFIVELPA